MSEYERGPIQTYEITWVTGHTERIQAHQVTWPGQGALMAGLQYFSGIAPQPTRSIIQFHGEIDGHWLLVLQADEAELRTIRLITVEEPVPGGTS